ncbi:hypothetical protein ANCCAN_05754 [Ancylostoma caninum]|uniref:INO80 complex subunit E N-terminal domain-containing protein n=1 Tax=Ancylostoma caninum TaxID=29170 RepID=A0A368GXA5_ANCCA|nr:hypothetical protein ANCCAN_05754 [Ancylostoma caninum]
MSEPETRLPTPGRVPPGSTSVGALPPLTLPPPRLDPLAGISSVHHSYASPSLTTQMMPSPIVQSGMMSPVSTQSPLSHQMLSPQQKSQVTPTGQAPQPQQLQDVRRQSVMLGQDQIRGQFSHTVTTLPSNKRANEMGRQIQSVPNSPASLAVSTPPQSVQVRHSSLDAQLSPGSSSVGNPSPSYSNHSSPSVVQLHNGHGPPVCVFIISPNPDMKLLLGSYVQSSTMHSHTGPSLSRYSSLPTQEQLQHHVAVGSLAAGPSKQGYQEALFQHEIQSRPVHQMTSSVASTTQVSSQSSTTITGGQPNVVIQQQPLPQISSQQNGQQCSLKPRPIPTQETLSRQLQSTSSQQQHVVMGLLHGAQLQQQQADAGHSGCGVPTVTNPHVRQILANRTSQALAVPGSSTAQQSGRVVGTASGALATLYDTDKSTATLTNKDAYRILKRRFKYLVYENECYQEELRNLQRKLLKLSRDKNFLLDRLGQFEKFSDSSDEDSDASHKTCDEKPKPKKRIRPAQRKRAADEGLEGSNAVKRPTEENIVSSPSPSESPIMDPRTSAYASAPSSSQPYRQMANTAPPSYERMAGPGPVSMSGSSFVVPQNQNVLQMGPSTVQPQQQILRSTLARVVPSSMLAQQSHSAQPYPSSSRHVVDTRPIVAKVRVETPSVSAMAGNYQGDQLKQQSLHKALSKAPISSQSMPMEYSHLSQEVLPNNPVNGDNYSASTSSALGPPVSMAPPPLESNAPLQPVSSLSSSFINGMIPDASNYAEKKEEKCSGAILAPTTSQHR